MIFHKLRYLFFAYLSLGFAKVLFVSLPPVVSVTGIIHKNGKLLCLDLSYYDGLGLPGGLVEGNEEPEDAIRREVNEETGLQVTKMRFLGTASSPFRGISSLSLVYELEVTGETHESNEGKIVWITAEEAVGKLTYPNARLTIERFVLDDKLV